MRWANESDYKSVDTRRGVDLPKFRLTDIEQYGSFTHRKGSGTRYIFIQSLILSMILVLDIFQICDCQVLEFESYRWLKKVIN